MSSDNDSDPATDLPTAQSLVRLRLLAEDAACRARDISETGGAIRPWSRSMAPASTRSGWPHARMAYV